MAEKESKQILLRISPTLYAKVVHMAEADFRSVNGEIEYILTMVAKQRLGSEHAINESNTEMETWNEKQI